MADKSKNLNPQKGRLNLLVMRSKGQVTNLSLSPFTLIFALLFAVIFIAVSVVVMNRHYVLYYDHKELEAAHLITARELHRLRSLYSYQSSVALEYAKIMNAMNRADPQSGLDISVPAIGELPPAEDQRTESENSGGEPTAVSTLDDWAALFPEPASPPEQVLNIDDLQVAGRNFRFQLTSETGGGDKVQGRMLLLFAVEDGEGRVVLRPFPNFEINSKDPDFNDGPGYNIRSSKQITGRLDMPAGDLVVEMMAVVKSHDGQVVLKKKVAPPSQ